MRMEKSILVPHLVLVYLTIMLAACSADAPEPTSLPPPEETQIVETPEPKLTITADDGVAQGEDGEARTPAVDETAVMVTPEATVEIEAEASPTPPASSLKAVIVSGDTAGVGKPFTFDATQSRPGETDIVNYVWTMGDGTTKFGISIQHAYSEPGFYTVNLIITDAAGQTDAEAKVVEIVELDQLATPTAVDQFVIVGTVWELDNAMRGTIVTLAFEEETLSGSAGCNDYVATHTIAFGEGSTSAISISSIRTTGDSCTVEVMAQERGYLDSLASARTITVEGNKLTMETGAGTLIFSEASN